MRIISQNGNIDLPYERTIVMHVNECVFAKCDGIDREIMFGKYSSMGKAYKAMEMARHHYCNINLPKEKAFRFPQDSEVEV